QNKRQEEIKQQEIDDAKALADKLKSLEVEISAKTGEGGKLFGSVSTKQITQALQKQHDIKVDKRKKNLQNGIQNLIYTIETIKNDKIIISIIKKQKTQDLKKHLDIIVDKLKMELPNVINILGYTNVPIKLHNKVSGTLKVHVVEE